MKEFTYVIKDKDGIHARPAGLFVKKASEFKSNVMVKKGEKEADAKRIFGVMGLGVKEGEEITVRIEGDDEDSAYAALEAFLMENL